MKKYRTWTRRSAESAKGITEAAKEADYLVITPSEDNWERPFHLSIFHSSTAQQDMESYIDDWDGKWALVSFSWLIGNVHFVDGATTF